MKPHCILLFIIYLSLWVKYFSDTILEHIRSYYSRIKGLSFAINATLSQINTRHSCYTFVSQLKDYIQMDIKLNAISPDLSKSAEEMDLNRLLC